jgi:hypothetical protein
MRSVSAGVGATTSIQAPPPDESPAAFGGALTMVSTRGHNMSAEARARLAALALVDGNDGCELSLARGDHSELSDLAEKVRNEHPSMTWWLEFLLAGESRIAFVRDNP